MTGQINTRELELGQLLSAVMTMIQERIGIVLGGSVFMSGVPLLVLLPAIFSAIALAAIPKEQIDLVKLTPFFMTAGICTLIYIPLVYALRLGWLQICLKITKNEPARFSEFFSNFQYFFSFLIANLLMSIAVTAGLFLLIVPGIFVGIRLIFTPMLILDKNMGPMEALQTSWSMVEGYGWKLFLAFLAFGVAYMIVGFIPFLGLIGQVLATAFLDLLICSLYRQRNGDLFVGDA